MMENILLTGGSGFIGTHLCRVAQQHGLSVYVLTRDTQATAKKLPADIHLVQSLRDLPSDIYFDTIINLAGEPLFAGRWSEQRKQAFRDSRIGMTEKLLAFFETRQQAPQLLISGSAIGYYGNHGDQKLDEASKCRQGFSHQLCQDWEHAAHQFERLGTRVCTLRTGLVLGQGGGILQKMGLPFKLGFGGRMGSGNQWMPWIHINDLIGIIFHIARRTDLRGGINGTAPAPVTNKTFTKTLGKVLKRPAWIPVPQLVLNILLGEMGSEMTASARVYPRKAMETGYQFEFDELELALRDLL